MSGFDRCEVFPARNATAWFDEDEAVIDPLAGPVDDDTFASLGRRTASVWDLS